MILIEKVMYLCYNIIVKKSGRLETAETLSVTCLLLFAVNTDYIGDYK